MSYNPLAPLFQILRAIEAINAIEDMEEMCEAARRPLLGKLEYMYTLYKTDEATVKAEYELEKSMGDHDADERSMR